MKVFGSHIVRHFTVWYLLISILNISIDPPDILSNLDSDFDMEEDLSLNEMESLTELVLEKVLQFKNAVPEADESDSESLIKKMNFVDFEICFQYTRTGRIYSQIFFAHYIDSFSEAHLQRVVQPPNSNM